MKKTLILSILLTFICYTKSFSQYKLKIIFKDGTEKTDTYKAKGWKLTSLTTDEKFHLNDMKEITYYKDDKSFKYYVIDTKTYVKSKRSKIRLARKAYEGKNIELYYVYFRWTDGHGTGSFSVNAYDEAFVKKKDEPYAYNMGYIYGLMYEGIKKRVRVYFKDCPELIQKVNKNKIKKKNTLEMVTFYDQHCGQ